MEPHDDLSARLQANRFRRERDTLVEGLMRLCGRVAPEPSHDAEQAVGVDAEFRAAYEAAKPHEWALVSRGWPPGAEVMLTETLHRLAENLGPRRVWLICIDREPQIVALAAELVLDNPLGFAAECHHELRLLDSSVQAGLWLVRHSHHGSKGTESTWELEVWGEPWLSASTRALRGIR